MSKTKKDTLKLFDEVLTASGLKRKAKGSCLSAESRVRMSDGKLKLISQVKVGEDVITLEGRPRCVKAAFKRYYTGNLYTIQTEDSYAPLSITADHKMAVHANSFEYSWKQPYEMNIEDLLICQKEFRTFPSSDSIIKLARCRVGYLTKIISITSKWVEDYPVYDLEVEEDHSFFAENLGSSNCSLY